MSRGEDLRRALVVLGMHRSGTSAMARVLSLCGAALPETLMPSEKALPTDPNREKGFWESQPLSLLNEEILRWLGSSWDALHEPYPSNWLETDVAIDFGRQLQQHIESEFAEKPFFVVKDPRISLLAPLWKRALDEIDLETSCVLLVRHPLEVADSLTARDGFSQSKGLVLWLKYFLAAEHNTRGCRRAFVAYDDLLANWRRVVSRVEADLGISLPLRTGTEEEVDAFLDPSFRHHRAAGGGGDLPNVPRWITDAYAWALRAAHGEPPDPVLLDGITAGVQRRLESVPRALAARESADEACGCEDPFSRLRWELVGRDQAALAGASVLELVSENEKISQVVDGLQLELAEAREDAAGLHHLEEELSELRAELARERGSVRSLLEGLRRDQQRLSECLEELVPAMTRELSLETMRAILLRPRRTLGWSGVLKGGFVWMAGKLPQQLLGEDLHARVEIWRQRRQLLASGLFDESFYLWRYRDVAALGIDPAYHYLLCGAAEGRDPSPFFSTAEYLERNPEVARSGVNPLLHFVLHAARGDKDPRREKGGSSG